MVAPQWKSNISGDVTKVWWGAMRSNRKSHDRKWHQSRDRKRPCPEVTLTGSMLCAACATGSCAISTLVGPFDRKWQSHVTGRGSVRKCPWPEDVLRMPGFFPHLFFLVVTWLPDVTEGHLTPSGFPWMCTCATGSCAIPVVTEGHVTPSEVSLGCSLRTPRPIFSMVIGSSPGYLPLLFSYNVYIGCVVLQGCPFIFI